MNSARVIRTNASATDYIITNTFLENWNKKHQSGTFGPFYYISNGRSNYFKYNKKQKNLPLNNDDFKSIFARTGWDYIKEIDSSWMKHTANCDMIFPYFMRKLF